MITYFSTDILLYRSLGFGHEHDFQSHLLKFLRFQHQFIRNRLNLTTNFVFASKLQCSDKRHIKLLIQYFGNSCTLNCCNFCKLWGIGSSMMMSYYGLKINIKSDKIVKFGAESHSSEASLAMFVKNIYCVYLFVH